MIARRRRAAVFRSARARLAVTYALVVLGSGTTLVALILMLFQVNVAIQPLDVSELNCAPLAAPAVVTPSPSAAFAIECRSSSVSPRSAASAVGDRGAPVQAVPVEAVLSRAVLEEAIRRLMPIAGISLVALAIAASILGWWMAGRALSPVKTITAAAHRLSDMTLHERIAVETRDEEFVGLANTMNAMLDRLQGAFDAQRDFVANVSHELRTPLAIARAEVDVTLADPEASIADLRRMAEVLRQATERCERVVDALRALVVAGQPLKQTAVDLESVVRDAMDAAAREVASRDLTVELELAPVTIAADEALLEQMVANLIRNAIVHNGEGGWIRIQTSATQEWGRLVVENSGRHVSGDDVPRLFDRFYRPADASGRGLGLGLAIVSAIVTAHSGTAQALPRVDGGLRVDVELPLTTQVDMTGA